MASSPIPVEGYPRHAKLRDPHISVLAERMYALVGDLLDRSLVQHSYDLTAGVELPLTSPWTHNC